MQSDGGHIPEVSESFAYCVRKTKTDILLTRLGSSLVEGLGGPRAWSLRTRIGKLLLPVLLPLVPLTTAMLALLLY